MENIERQLHNGVTVEFQGRLYRTEGIRTWGVAAPYFRLQALGDYPDVDLTSHILLRAVEVYA